jgi:hypothetical protein
MQWIVTMKLCLRRHSLISVIAVLGAILGSGLRTSADAPLTMTVAPHIWFAPADLRVRVELTPAARNRSLVVVAESEDYFRSSEIPLEGAESPRSLTVQFRGLPQGEYLVSGEVQDADGRTIATVRQDVRVLQFSSIQ